MKRVLRFGIALYSVVAVAGLLFGCSGASSRQSVDAQLDVDPSVLAEVQSLDMPGVDDELAGVLKAELLRSISEYSRGKVVSSPPCGAENCVSDLASEDDGTGGRNLTWTYRNVGDYDQNSEVNAADITSVGLHYGATSSSPDWVSARLADGDGNGEVNVADITPIGRNFNTSIAKYMVYSSTDSRDYPTSHDAANGPGATLLGVVAMSECTAGSGGCKLFSYALGAVEAGTSCWVRPHDGAAEGSPSNSHEVPAPANSPPVAALAADPQFGDIPMLVQFDASGSSDPDGSIVKYEWDWDGFKNGLVWEDTETTPTASYTYTEIDTYTAFMRVTDDQGAMKTASIEIRATAPGNDPPVAVLAANPASGEPPLMVSFDASGSYDPDGVIVKYEWDWDGSENWVDTGDTCSTSHEYAAGSYTAWVKVTDELGETAVDSVSISATGLCGPWPMFGNDLQHTHRSPYTGAQTNHVKWSYTTGGALHSCPAIAADGTVFVGSDDGNLYAINADGSLKWSYKTGGRVHSSPAIAADGTVYVGSYDDNLYAINPDGSLKWSYATGDDVWSSPSIGADGTVYVGSNDNKLHAINPDGSLKWSFTTGGDVHSAPAIGADVTVYVGSKDHSLYAINPDGSLKWSYTTGDSIRSSPAIGADGTVYVGSYDDNVYAIKSDGSLKWSYATGPTLGVYSSPAIGTDGCVYVGSDDGDLYALNPDGSLRWSYHAVGWESSSPAISADGTVYVGSCDNKMYAINPDGSLKWSYLTDGDVRSSPSIGADGTVYVGSFDKKLYAFGP